MPQKGYALSCWAFNMWLHMFVFIDSYFRDSIKKDGSILLMNTFVGTYFDSLH